MTSQIDSLTQRELEVLQVLADPVASLREVAGQLHVSYSTVKWYTRQIYGKLDVNSREEAIKKAWGIGLLSGAKEIPNNLPAPLTQFIGRKQEITELTSLILDAHTRLVTVLATGGMGKTALALETARRLIKSSQKAAHFSDGIYFISLTAIDNAEFVLASVANRVGFIFEQRANPKQQFLDYLREKHMLLILDNFEHVLEATDLIIDILQTAPNISIVVTSRERLNLSAEAIYSLGGMLTPLLEDGDDLFQFESVTLFAQCIQRIRHNFKPEAHHLYEIRRICYLSSGMPLALVLAAALFSSFTLREIADEIEANLDILQTSLRDIPQRLQSVRAVFESVWSRLTEQEQDVFLRMSVFRGGGTREAVLEVTGARASVLQGLINKALLSKTESGRYEIHELLRQYAEERLTQLPELAQVIRDRHCAYYAELIARWEWWTHTQEGYLGMKGTAEVDWDNITTAWTWAGKQTYDQRVWQLYYPIACVSWHRGWFNEATLLFQNAIENLEISEIADNDPLLLASLYAGHAYISTYLQLDEQVRHSASRSREYLQAADSHTNQPEVLFILNSVAQGLKTAQPIAAAEISQQMINLSRQQGKFSNLVWAFFEWTMVEFGILGNTQGVKPIITEALELAKEQDIANLTMHFTYLLAAVHYHEGDLIEARRLTNESLAIADAVGDKVNSNMLLVLLGDICLKDGDIQSCRNYYKQALSGYDKVSRKPRFILSLFMSIAELYLQEQQVKDAIRLASFVNDHPFRHAYWSPHERAQNLLQQLSTTHIQPAEETTNIDAIFDHLMAEL